MPTTQELIDAKAAVRGYGLEVIRQSDTHYQIRTLRDANLRWMLDLWPSTQRFTGNEHRPPPHDVISAVLCSGRPWKLMDIVEAVVSAMPNNKVPADEPPQKDEPVFAPGIRIGAEEWRFGFTKQLALLTRMAVATETTATKLDNIVGRLERLEEAYRADGKAATKLADLHAEAAAVTAETCDEKPDAEPVPGVTMADAEAVLRKAKFTPEWIYSSGHHEIFVSTARLLFGEMLKSKRRELSRVYYHEMLREVCQIVDRWSDDVILCGSADSPSTSLVDAVRAMARVALRVTIEPFTGECCYDCPPAEAEAGRARGRYRVEPWNEQVGCADCANNHCRAVKEPCLSCDGRPTNFEPKT